MARADEIDMREYLKQRKKIPVLNNNYEYVTVKEYAKIIKSHPVTVIRWLGRGKIDGAIKAEGRWKIPIIKEKV